MNIQTKKDDITMKKMHALFVAVIALALALSSGSARAGFVIIFDDPDTAEIDFRVESWGSNLRLAFNISSGMLNHVPSFENRLSK